jgi:hypothetical protein
MTTAHEHDTCDVSFLAGKFIMFHVWRRQDGCQLLRVIKGHFCSQIPVILRYNDWLVLEIITQWTGKTIL